MGNLQWAINNLQLAECHPELVEGSNLQFAICNTCHAGRETS